MVSWILLATPAHAIVYSKRGDHYEIIKKFKNELERKKGTEIWSDRPGSSLASPAFQDMSPLEERGYFEMEVHHKFANEIMDFIEKCRHLGKFQSLQLVTSKNFAGNIRENISTSLSQTIDREILKNFYTEDIRELKEFLNQHKEDQRRSA